MKFFQLQWQTVTDSHLPKLEIMSWKPSFYRIIRTKCKLNYFWKLCHIIMQFSLVIAFELIYPKNQSSDLTSRVATILFSILQPSDWSQDFDPFKRLTDNLKPSLKQVCLPKYAQISVSISLFSMAWLEWFKLNHMGFDRSILI